MESFSKSMYSFLGAGLIPVHIPLCVCTDSNQSEGVFIQRPLREFRFNNPQRPVHKARTHTHSHNNTRHSTGFQLGSHRHMGLQSNELEAIQVTLWLGVDW